MNIVGSAGDVRALRQLRRELVGEAGEDGNLILPGLSLETVRSAAGGSESHKGNAAGKGRKGRCGAVMQ